MNTDKQTVTDSRTVAGIYKSGYDGSYWRKFADDRPNQVVSADELTPEQIRQLEQTGKTHEPNCNVAIGFKKGEICNCIPSFDL